jgi:hypothetical protein
MKIKNSVNILGTEYKIIGAKDTPKLRDLAGYIEVWAKEIVYDAELTKNKDDKCSKKTGECLKQVMRHEIMHAFYHEAGASQYGDDENLVEMMAILIPKIVKAMKEVNVL